MDTIVDSALGTHLATVADHHGVQITSSDGHKWTGTQETIKAKWFLGGRKVIYRMSCDLDESSRTARFRESVLETSWGIPPPTLTIETTTQHGTTVNEARTDRSVDGGGHLDYGCLRAAFEQAVQEAGWKFVLETGKQP